MFGTNPSLTGTRRHREYYGRVAPDAIKYVPFRDAEHVATTAETAPNLRQINVAVRTVLRLVRNIYANNPGKLAAWASASHVEAAPKKKAPTTP
jgi:hypothetical protein